MSDKRATKSLCCWYTRYRRRWSHILKFKPLSQHRHFGGFRAYICDKYQHIMCWSNCSPVRIDCSKSKIVFFKVAKPWTYHQPWKQTAFFNYDKITFSPPIPGSWVSDIEPDYGSLGGETRITVQGGGKFI